jgi:hypothetical protein
LLAIACITILAACWLVAVVGTRIVRSKQRRLSRPDLYGQQLRRWRPARKPESPKDKD